MKMGSLFSGSGGFELAGERVGFHTVWESEIEPFPMRVTQMRFPDAEHLGDISRINGAQVKPVDVVTGGSPCQNMSIAGNRTGLDGEKSVLFREYVRIVKEMRVAHGKPRFMVWENVPGAFSSNKGEDFRCVLEKSPESHKSEFLFLDLRAGDGSQPEASWETATAWPGASWMPNTGASPSEEKESTLLQILEDGPQEKYYLSEKACAGILRRAQKRGKSLPEKLKTALERQASGGGGQ